MAGMLLGKDQKVQLMKPMVTRNASNFFQETHKYGGSSYRRICQDIFDKAFCPILDLAILTYFG